MGEAERTASWSSGSCCVVSLELPERPALKFSDFCTALLLKNKTVNTKHSCSDF